MEGRIREAMDARVSVRLEEAGRLVYEGTGGQAGLEVVHPDLLRSFVGGRPDRA
jgi:hypothetical protein